MTFLRGVIGSGAEGYAPLGHGAETRLSDAIRYVRKMSRFFVVGGIFLICLLGLVTVSKGSIRISDYAPGGSRPESYTAPSGASEISEGPVYIGPHQRRFVIVVPATDPHPNLCKTVMSAIALGYPSPIIVNFGRDYRPVSHYEGGGRNLLKIPGVTAYLDAALRPDAHHKERLDENDIVLVVDGYDAWFQLPPEVMLQRYHDINAAANARLLAQWKEDGPMPMKQSVIVAAQKRCFPDLAAHSNTNTHCDALPESPLRADLYGPETDKNASDYARVRPRFINGGVYIGTAGDMRHMLRRAANIVHSSAEKGLRLTSEQGVTGQVLGEQEVWRQWRRRNNGSTGEMAELMSRDYEVHIGLDYRQEISIPTVFAEESGDITKLSDTKGIKKASEQLGIDPIRLTDLPEDVQKAHNPLKGIVDNPSWKDMPLYADLWTESVPAIMHHNAHKDGLKSRRVSWWGRTWYFKHLRELLKRWLEPGEMGPVAKVIQNKLEIEYWAPTANEEKRRPRMMKTDSLRNPLKEMSWEEVCRDPKEPKDSLTRWWDEVFQDGKGSI